jgi:hypothetical protein
LENGWIEKVEGWCAHAHSIFQYWDNRVAGLHTS